MKKRVIAVLTAVLMTASLAGCGSGKLSNDYVTVNKYKGLEVTEVAKNEVSDDSVEKEIQSRLEAVAKSLISLYSFLRIIRVLILQENRQISTLY